MSTSKSRTKKTATSRRKPSQLKFESAELRRELRFGGSLMKKAKGRTARPISSKDPMHVVLRSSKAKGVFGFGYHANLKRVNEIVKRHCSKYGVKLIEYSNNYNHLHLLVKFPSRAVYLRFIRSLTGHLAMAVTGANRLRGIAEILSEAAGRRHQLSNAEKEVLSSKGFWDFRPFTRVVRSFKGFKVARDYVVLNQLEAMEILPKRSGRLRDVAQSESHYFRKRAAKVS